MPEGLLKSATSETPLGIPVPAWSRNRLKRYMFVLLIAALVLAISETRAVAQPSLAKQTIPIDAPADVRQLLEQCYSPSASARGDAAKKLGELKGAAASAVPHLLAMMGDSESYMDSIRFGTMVIHGSSNPGRQAALAAGRIGGAATVALMKIVASPSHVHRELGIVGLGATGDPNAVPVLLGALKDKDVAIRGAVVDALAQMNDKRAIEPLIHALSDAGKDIPERAALGLRAITGQSFEKDAPRWLEWWKAEEARIGAAPVPGQPSIQGTVMGVDGAGLVGVEVKLARLKGEEVDPGFKPQSTRTDSAGAFVFAGLESGAYTLTVSAKFQQEADLPCRPSGLLARNTNKWLVAVARTADGGVVEIVTSDPLQVESGKTRRETIDLRCS